MNDLDFRDARVLIIDDQEMNIAMLSGMLKKHGFRQRFSANDPFAGIEMFQRIAPHLVLLDIEMPGLDGFGVLARIRQLSPDVMIPVIVLTAHTEQAVRLKAIDAGASDFLTKPFDGMEVVGRARNMSILGMMSRRIADENRRLDEAVKARTAKLEQMIEILRTAEMALSAKVNAADQSTNLMRALAARGARNFSSLAETVLETSLSNAGETPEWLAVSGAAERIKLTAEEIELIVDAETARPDAVAPAHRDQERRHDGGGRRFGNGRVAPDHDNGPVGKRSHPCRDRYELVRRGAPADPVGGDRLLPDAGHDQGRLG